MLTRACTKTVAPRVAESQDHVAMQLRADAAAVLWLGMEQRFDYNFAMKQID